MNTATSHVRSTRRTRRTWLIAMLAVLSVVAGWLLWRAILERDRRSADERLAEVEAARAIPETENAATIYNQLLDDPNGASAGDDLPEGVSPSAFERACREPWRSQDLPALASWVAKHQSIAAKLLNAFHKEKCRFPITIDVTDDRPMDRVSAMRWWGYLLITAANSDLADGRIDDALLKWHCLIQMDNHLRQQPTRMDHLSGMSTTRFVTEAMAQFLVRGAPTEAHLQKIEAMPLITVDSSAQYLRETHEIDQLVARKRTENFGPLERLRYLWTKHVLGSATRGIFPRTPVTEEAYLYRRSTAMARGMRILVALRRYKNATGRWPESLAEVRSSLSEEILTDPFNKGTFVYQRTSDTFRLYSKGQNSKDQDGRWDPDAGLDDWLIWPPHRWGPLQQES